MQHPAYDPDETVRVESKIQFETTEPLRPIAEVTDSAMPDEKLLSVSPENAVDNSLMLCSGPYRVDKNTDIDDLRSRIESVAEPLDGLEIQFDGVQFPSESEDEQPVSVIVPAQSEIDTLENFRDSLEKIIQDVDGYTMNIGGRTHPYLTLGYTAQGIPAEVVSHIQTQLQDVQTAFTLTVDTDRLLNFPDLDGDR